MFIPSHRRCNWNILLDSDNEIDTSYIDSLFEIEEWDERTAYLPSYAMPTFDYREFSGVIITKENVAELMGERMFTTMLNTHNHFVNKRTYFEAFDSNQNPVTCDSIFINWRWLANGGKLFVVPGLRYWHMVHEHSHYKQNSHKDQDFHRYIEQQLRQMK